MDLTIKNSRYFHLILPRENHETGEITAITLDVEPCKSGTLGEISSINEKSTFDEIVEVTLKIVNKNKTKYKVNKSIILDLDIDQLIQLITEYLEWVMAEKKANPN